MPKIFFKSLKAFYKTKNLKFLKVVKDNRQSNVTYYIAYGNRICLLLIYVIYYMYSTYINYQLK